MKKYFFLFLLFLPFLTWAEGSIKFVPNKGQWAENIVAQANLKGGWLYIEKNALVFVFADADQMQSMHHVTGSSKTDVPGHAYKISFDGSNSQPIVTFDHEFPEWNHYYFGSRRGENIHPVGKIILKEIYPNTDLELESEHGFFKYNFILNPGADSKKIRLSFDGVTPKLGGNGTLVIPTSVNIVQENAPYAFEKTTGAPKKIGCAFQLSNQVVSFQLKGKSITQTTRVIDPLLIFSTYTGSTADNWGYTATYDYQGNAFGGGIVYFPQSVNPNGYPTLGAIQNLFQGGVDDIVLTKFINNGSALQYSTYLGGRGSDQPMSLVADTTGNLFVLGRSNSNNFPVVARCYDTSANGATDLVLLKISPNGTLLSSTYVGGNNEDGVNGASTVEDNGPTKLNYNYGDNGRGEIVLDDSGSVFVATTTRSSNFPARFSFDQVLNGIQDGIIFRMDSNLTTIKWSAFLGGNSEDALYSIIVHDSSIYVAGGTKSGDFPTTPFAHLKNAPGSMDGFITKIMKNGQGIYQSTYVGTSAYDQTFFVRKDHEGGVYFFGQTEGSVTPSAGCFSAGNSKQTLGKFSSNLDTLRWITTFGSGNQAGPNISPTAFEVDSCGRIYLAGWGGEDNRITNTHAGYTDSLPLRNPFQAKTDSSDFYLMALEQNASTLLFGSYLGGNKSADHVDGGTSRFDSKGIMYHAVCASCGSATNDFPTTANAWSRTENSGNCNLAVFKFDFRSAAILRAGFEIDSTKAMCAPLDLVPKNTSIGPKTLKYLWTTSTGQVDTAFEPHLLFSFPGYYTIKLLVWDSAGGPCSKADSLEVSFRIKDRQLKADFLAGGQLNRCAPLDINYLASCTGATFDTKYIWYLNGDSVSSDPNPKIHIDSSGKYVVRLVAIDSSTCNIVDSLDQKLTLSSLKRNLLPPTACFCKTDSNLKLEPLISGKDYTWSGAGSGTIPLIKPEKTGLYILKMKDSLDCDQIDSIDIVVNDCGKEIFNVITPNSDGANDEFQPIPMEDAPDSYQLTIFNRWGQPVFRSRNHQESWKGTSQISGDALPDSTYFFELRATYCNGFKVEKSGIIKLIR